MIGYIKGKVLLIGETDNREIIVEAGASGVGYRILMASSSAAELRIGQPIELHIYTQVREDAIDLYGFNTRDERTLFSRLVTVNGVGAKLALSILDALSPAELQNAVLSADIATLKRIPGIGPKVANRLVLELESYLHSCKFGDFIPLAATTPKSGSLHDDTRSALRNLGFADSEIERLITSLDQDPQAHDAHSVQDEIRWCLQHR